tara:strand:- start:449 stop:1111 length:663 start_codon:yes stop_codon:yes gene_type:complete
MTIAKEKYAFFDFCGTCVNLQTGNAFLIKMIKEQKSLHHFVIAKILTSKILSKLFSLISKNISVKKILLSFLKGVPYDNFLVTAKDFASSLEEIKSTKILKKLSDLSKDEYKIVIVSGGFSMYIEFFFQKYAEVYVISNEISFFNNACDGKMTKPDCLGFQKISRIKNEIGLDFDTENSVVFSDCPTDKPLFELVKKHRWLTKLSFEKNKINTTLEIFKS